MTQANEPTELTTALIAGLAIQAGQLADAAKDLKESYRFSRALKVVITIGFLMLTGIIVIALQNRQTAGTVRTNTAAIRDCTTPGGDCYQRAQDTTGRAVADIVASVNAHTDLVFVATLECSHRLNRSDVAFEACLHGKGIR